MGSLTVIAPPLDCDGWRYKIWNGMAFAAHPDHPPHVLIDGRWTEVSARSLEAKSHEEEEVGKEVLSTETAGVATDSRRLPLDYQELKLWT